MQQRTDGDPVLPIKMLAKTCFWWVFISHNLWCSTSVEDQIEVSNAGTFLQSLTTLMEEFTLINKQRNRIKVFKPFEDISEPSPSIDATMVSYVCVCKRSSKPVMKGSRVETLEAAREEYKKLLEDGWKKTSIFNSYF